MVKAKARRAHKSKAVRRSRPARSAAQLRSTAYHEAGHAVIGRVLTLVCGSATIKADYERLVAGHSITFEPYACEAEWEKRGRYRSRNSVWHARIIALMAGAESEQELLGKQALSDGSDKREIAWMKEELSGISEDQFWQRFEPRLRAMTRMLVRRHRARIERVAKALLAKTTLSRRQVDKLVGRSVADVKPSPPLVMNESELAALRAALDKLKPVVNADERRGPRV
jgi:ATP-dependent Zn protease